MKKLILLLCVFGFASFAQAQTYEEALVQNAVQQCEKKREVATIAMEARQQGLPIDAVLLRDDDDVSKSVNAIIMEAYTIDWQDSVSSQRIAVMMFANKVYADCLSEM